jgi:hypothetical protein
MEWCVERCATAGERDEFERVTVLFYGLSTVIGVCVMSGAVGFAHDLRFATA